MFLVLFLVWPAPTGLVLLEKITINSREECEKQLPESTVERQKVGRLWERADIWKKGIDLDVFLNFMAFSLVTGCSG